MSHSFAILGDTVAVADVSVPFVDFTSLSFRKTEVQKDGAVVATFVDVSVDASHEVLVSVRIKDIPARGAALARREWSITYSSWATDTDSVSGDIVYSPITSGMFGSWPLAELEVADLRDLLGNVYSLTFVSVSSKVPVTTVISSILHGLPKLYS